MMIGGLMGGAAGGLSVRGAMNRVTAPAPTTAATPSAAASAPPTPPTTAATGSANAAAAVLAAVRQKRRARPGMTTPGTPLLGGTASTTPTSLLGY